MARKEKKLGKNKLGYCWENAVRRGRQKGELLQVVVFQGFAKLPGQDSNLDKESQNLLCYRYTTGYRKCLPELLFLPDRSDFDKRSDYAESSGFGLR
jgi:hypothetical protein